MMKRIVWMLLLGGAVLAGHAETLSGVCMVSASRDGRVGDKADVLLRGTDCDGRGPECGVHEDSDVSWARWSGASAEALTHEGAQVTAEMRGDAGDLKCAGTVHDGVLAGRYVFEPSGEFVQKMGAMGFDGLTANKQLGMLMLDVTIAWVRQMQALGVTEMTTGNLTGMKALGVSVEYIRGMAAAGYPELRARKLMGLKAVGATPEKAREAKAMGFSPSEEDLNQMCVFHIDAAFVERMRAKGFKDLTLHRLIQIKIFKLDE